jgi:hypothetical protein
VPAGVPLAASSPGFPSRFGWLIADALVLVPCDLGLLFFPGKKRNGKFSLNGCHEKLQTVALRTSAEFQNARLERTSGFR